MIGLSGHAGVTDLIIPADDKGGSTSDAGVLAFVDFMIMDRPESQLLMLGGLAWLDADSRKKAGALFVELSDGDRKEFLDELVWLEVSAPDGR